MRYQGKCHCGRIQFEVECELTDVLECNCSICYQSGYLHWMIMPAQPKVKTPLDQASFTNGVLV